MKYLLLLLLIPLLPIIILPLIGAVYVIFTIIAFFWVPVFELIGREDIADKIYKKMG